MQIQSIQQGAIETVNPNHLGWTYSLECSPLHKIIQINSSIHMETEKKNIHIQSMEGEGAKSSKLTVAFTWKQKKNIHIQSMEGEGEIIPAKDD